MTFDANSYCPGGTGKKIKHCECRDIVGDLEKIGKALEGGQRVAALDRINRVLATKAHRPCLLALKANTLVQMNELQAFEDTVTTFVKVAPQNGLAHCFESILESRKGRVREAIDALQSVYECTTENFPSEIVLALVPAIDLLMHANEYLSARAHAVILNLFAPEDQLAQQAMISLSGMLDVPLVLKVDRALEECPEGASWKSRFDAALMDGNALRWRKALTRFEKLNEEFAQTPAILWNIALLRSLLALPHQAEAWRAFARCPGANEEMAIDAESIAQMIRFRDEMPEVALMRWTAEVTDANELNERLLSTPGVVSIPVGPWQQTEDNGPPPKAVFALLDRPDLGAGVEVTAENVPQRIATLLLFGRETDRPARLSVGLTKTEEYDSYVAKLNEIGGNLFTGERKEEVIEMTPRFMVEILTPCHFARETQVPVRQRVSNELMQRRLVSRWPHIAQECLGGKTPAEVAADPAWRIPLQAALRSLEYFGDSNRLSLDVDAIRSSLGLPIPALWEATDGAAATALTSLHRVDLGKLSDEQLVSFYDLARIFMAVRAMRRFGDELLRRGNIQPPDERYQMLLDLAQNSIDREVAVGYLSQAKHDAAAANMSPAAALLSELSLRLLGGETAQAQEILNTLQTKHMREPGVAEMLLRLLRQFGIIRDEHLQEMQQPDAAAAPHRPATPAAGSGLWTPDAPAASGEGERTSKLWLPD